MLLLKALFPLTIIASALPVQKLQNGQSLSRRDTLSEQGPQDFPAQIVMNGVSNSLNELTKAIKKFDGEAINAVPVLDVSQAIIKKLKDGPTEIMAGTTMGLVDAISILLPVYTLYTAADNAVKSLIEKKPLFDKAYVTIVVADQLEQYKETAQKLVDAIVAKLPAYLPGVIGTTIAGPILTIIDNAVAAYKPA
jgi:hypothetical protein